MQTQTAPATTQDIATVYDIESDTVLYQLPADDARRDLAMHQRRGATITEYATTDRAGRPVHAVLTVDAPRADYSPDQGAVYLFTSSDSTPNIPAAPAPASANPQTPATTGQEQSTTSSEASPDAMNGKYQAALATYDAIGAAHAPDDALMAGFCEHNLHLAVGAVSPQLVWEGAQKTGMTALELCRLAGRDPMAVDALQWL